MTWPRSVDGLAVHLWIGGLVWSLVCHASQAVLIIAKLVFHGTDSSTAVKFLLMEGLATKQFGLEPRRWHKTEAGSINNLTFL